MGPLELKTREPVHLAGSLCVTPSSRGLPPAPPLLGVLGTLFVRRSLPESREHGRSSLPSPPVRTHHPPPLHQRSLSSSWDLFLHLGSFLVLAPRRRHPLPPPPADSSRLPYPSTCPYPSSSCPFKCYPPTPSNTPPAAQGWGRRRRRHPARATCAAAAARGPALLQVRPGTPAPDQSPRAGPLLWSPAPGIPAARDSGSDSPPAGAALPLSPALSSRPFLPCPLRPESGGFSLLSANLSRVPLLF